MLSADQASGAVLSADGRYRFLLWRAWDLTLPTLNAVMLNPSYADAHRNDATVTQLIRRARDLGFGRLTVTNASPFRSREPMALREIGQMLRGPGADSAHNDLFLAREARIANMVLCGWGHHAKPLGLHERTLAALLTVAAGKLHYLKLNADGTPHHPLRLPYLNDDGTPLRPTLWK